MLPKWSTQHFKCNWVYRNVSKNMSSLYSLYYVDLCGHITDIRMSVGNVFFVIQHILEEIRKWFRPIVCPPPTLLFVILWAQVAKYASHAEHVLTLTFLTNILTTLPHHFPHSTELVNTWYNVNRTHFLHFSNRIRTWIAVRGVPSSTLQIYC